MVRELREQREPGDRASDAQTGKRRRTTSRLTLEEAFRGTEREFQIGPNLVRARIPKGAGDGQQLKLRGKGGPGANGGPPGDLFLHIALEPHPLFREFIAASYKNRIERLTSESEREPASVQNEFGRR